MWLNFKDKLINWRWLKSWRPYFVIIVLGFLLYSPSLGFDLTYLDDNTLLIDNYELISSVKNIPQIFSDDVFFAAANFYYRPLLNISFLLDAQIAGDTFFVYHLSNILFHLLAACLVFLLLQKMLHRRPLAFFFSLIFLVHPVLTQAVAWIPGRNDSLLAIFIFGSFYLFLKFLEEPRLYFYIAHAVLLFLALLTKESAVFLPFLLIFYFLFIGAGKLRRSDKWLLVVAYGAVGFIWALMRKLALGASLVSVFDIFSGIFQNLSAVIISFGKILLPFNLSVFPILIDSTLVYGIIAVLILIFIISISKHINKPRLIFGFLWFLAFLLPSFFRPNTSADFLEHRLYLPFFGFLLTISEIEVIKKLDFSRSKVRWLSLGILALFAVITFSHGFDFRNKLSFWRAAVKSSPHSALAQKNTGAMYYLDGELEIALPYYLQALELNPQEPMVNNNIGLIYKQQGDQEKAEKFFLRELALYPNYDKALFNLGILYFEQKKFSEAQFLMSQVLQVNPYYHEARKYLENLNNFR